MRGWPGWRHRHWPGRLLGTEGREASRDPPSGEGTAATQLRHALLCTERPASPRAPAGEEGLGWHVQEAITNSSGPWRGGGVAHVPWGHLGCPSAEPGRNCHPSLVHDSAGESGAHSLGERVGCLGAGRWAQAPGAVEGQATSQCPRPAQAILPEWGAGFAPALRAEAAKGACSLGFAGIPAAPWPPGSLGSGPGEQCPQEGQPGQAMWACGHCSVACGGKRSFSCWSTAPTPSDNEAYERLSGRKAPQGCWPQAWPLNGCHWHENARSSSWHPEMGGTDEKLSAFQVETPGTRQAQGLRARR